MELRYRSTPRASNFTDIIVKWMHKIRLQDGHIHINLNLNQTMYHLYFTVQLIAMIGLETEF